MQLTNKQSLQINLALHNTLDKTKTYIRRTNEIPIAVTVFQWFEEIWEYNIIKDKAPIDASNLDTNQFEAIFFFSAMRVYLSL